MITGDVDTLVMVIDTGIKEGLEMWQQHGKWWQGHPVVEEHYNPDIDTCPRCGSDEFGVYQLPKETDSYGIPECEYCLDTEHDWVRFMFPKGEYENIREVGISVHGDLGGPFVTFDDRRPDLPHDMSKVQEWAQENFQHIEESASLPSVGRAFYAPERKILWIERSN